MKTIIHATDFSDNSISALKYAHSLSKKLDAKLRVIHVFSLHAIPGIRFNPTDIQLNTNIMKDFEAKILDLCKRTLGDDIKNVEVEAIENSSIVKGILGKITEIKPLLLVLGMKGQSVFKDLIMGNTTRHLIEKSNCPLLAVPDDYNTMGDISTIIYATDFQSKDGNAIAQLSELARVFMAEIKVVHFSKKNHPENEHKMRRLKAELSEKTKYNKIKFEVVVADNSFYAINAYLRKTGANLLAMLEKEKVGFIKKIIHENLVQKMNVLGSTPLLSYNESSY
ncbi:universal stress protein [Spongiivirga sp. MCCC 1A20706]|uniref:universal stress protein n=1 Tax=Spongiivirga sp. MCCC 1A20706 TaxID=3160963 RepID=UPI0039776211